MIELIVEREVRSTSYARVLTAYRPIRTLGVGGHYRLDAHYLLNTSQEFSVVEPDFALPARPELVDIGFSVHEGPWSAFNARFTFEPFEGTLVVDADGTLADPFEGLDVTWRPGQGDQPVFYLANEPPCYINFAKADWGEPATPRFGIMDLAGNFSGWSEPVAIEFPVEATDYPEVEAARELHIKSDTRGGCSLAAGISSTHALGLLSVVIAAGVIRRRRDPQPLRSFEATELRCATEPAAGRLRRYGTAR